MVAFGYRFRDACLKYDVYFWSGTLAHVYNVLVQNQHVIGKSGFTLSKHDIYEHL